MARHPRELLLLKEAIHIQMTPAEERFNRDTGLELPGCRVAVLRRQEDSTKQVRNPLTDCVQTVIADDAVPRHKKDTFLVSTLVLGKQYTLHVSAS